MLGPDARKARRPTSLDVHLERVEVIRDVGTGPSHPIQLW
jgi:hypothetical protein